MLTFGLLAAGAAPLWWVDSFSAQQVSGTSSWLDAESVQDTV